MTNEDKIYMVEGTLDIDFSSVPFDNKKDFNKIKSKIKAFTMKLLDEYNSTGTNVEFEDNTTGEYDL